MTTLTVKIEDKKQAGMLYQMLRSINFVIEVEMDESPGKDEMKILEERWEDYKINPESGKPLDTVVKEISKRYGFKNRH